MFDRSAQLELLLDLESRQDDVMQRLDELDRRVEKTLGECLALRGSKRRRNRRCGWKQRSRSLVVGYSFPRSRVRTHV